ncbi:MAG: aminoacyl-tRNA hydrolase [Calditrichaeota bacterium]|nr:aminoacyl-tRNA hydrolase [Calditrichota bacterium]
MTQNIKLVVFLGNPGAEYAKTRHNVGWMIADEFALLSAVNWQQKFKGLFCQSNVGGSKIYFLKPMTFMNLSGESVQAAMQFFKIKPEEVLVVHDEIELDFGVIGFKKGGGLGGHNGLRSIEKQIGTRDFYRFRIGVSRPAHGNVASYVLSRFSSEEQEWLPGLLEKSASLLEKCLSEGIDGYVKEFAKEKVF